MNTRHIEADGVGKKFSQSIQRLMINAPLDIMRSVLGVNRRAHELRKGEFWAVEDLSFRVEPGTRIGLIGRNGSGKSTVLKMLNGILLPDKGTIRTRGRMGALIEVGAGFHPLLTGRENIFVNGAILGMKHAEIRRKFDEIVAFADIAGFLDSPVKFYSSGMYVRLGFAVAAHAEPDVLLLDEVLAVGDIQFQKKCFDRLDQIANQGTTIVLVSHSMAAVQRLCPSAILLERGRMVYMGDSREAVARLYQSSLRSGRGAEATSRTDEIVHKEGQCHGVYLKGFAIGDAFGQRANRIVCGSPVQFTLQLGKSGDAGPRLPRVAIRLIDSHSEELLANIQTPSPFMREIELGTETILDCTVQSLNLSPGIYTIEVKIGGDGEDLHDLAAIREPIELTWSADVLENMFYKGKVYLPGTWNVGSADPEGQHANLCSSPI